MNSMVTKLSAPSRRRDRAPSRFTVASAVVAVAAFLAAAATAAAFVPWGKRYEAIYFQATEAYKTPRYPQGFLLTGALESTALVLLTATALLAAAAAFSGRRVQTVPARTLALSAAAALLAATVLPASVLYGYLSVVPAIAAIAAVVLILRNRPGAAAIKPGELAGWGAVIVAAEVILLPGFGILAAAALAFTRLRQASGALRWGLGLFSLLFMVIHVLAFGGGPLL